MADFPLLLFVSSHIFFKRAPAPKASFFSVATIKWTNQEKDWQLTAEEVCRQVDPNNNKTGFRSREGKRTDPNNGHGRGLTCYEKWQWTSHSLFIAVQSWAIYFFSSMSSKGSWHKTSSRSQSIHVTVRRQRGERGEPSRRRSFSHSWGVFCLLHQIRIHLSHCWLTSQTCRVSIFS